MTYIADLTEQGKVTTVGYLDRGHDYTRGEASDEVLRRLVSLVKLPVLYWFGYHHCDLDPCWSKERQRELRYQGFLIAPMCDSEIWVPEGLVLYQAPSLILHYICGHQYLPPACFVKAVLNCPEPGSQEYLAAVERVWPEASQDLCELRKFQLRRQLLQNPDLTH
jgi:hypothetical protein